MLRIEPLILDSDSRALYDRFVPATHPLRQFNNCLDFSFILPLVAERYHDEIGRPAEHPEQMYRLLFAQFYLNLSDEKIYLAAHEGLALRPFLHRDSDTVQIADRLHLLANVGNTLERVLGRKHTPTRSGENRRSFGRREVRATPSNRCGD